MSKTHRGKGVRGMQNKARGTCPVCKTTRIKLLYDRKLEDETTAKVCKRCSVQAAS